MDFFRPADAIGHQADIRWADAQLCGYPSVKPQVQLVNA